MIFGNVIQEVDNINLGNFTWNRIKTRGDDPLGRCGHTSVIYRTKLMIYGGATPFDPFKSREDILIFDTGKILLIRY
jgi:hypothetical protein